MKREQQANGHAQQSSKKLKSSDADAEPTLCNIEAHLSEAGRARQLASLRILLTQFAGLKDIVGLHGGLPPAEAFPITEMQLKLRDGTTLNIADPSEVAAAQQYSVTPAGYPALVDWLQQHTWEMHSPVGTHELMVTLGSNHTLEMLLALLMEKGDSLLCEEYTYPHVVESLLKPSGFGVEPVAMDGQGMVPARLQEVLERCRQRGGRQPRVLYTVPTGQNPTGVNCPEERRRALYDICRRYDVIILEDDPYYYLQWKQGKPKGLQNLGKSYLSMDKDERVVRLDSFSKVLAPGLRLGWATGPPKLMEKLRWHLHGSVLGATSTSQVLVANLLQHWGKAGFEAHVTDMQRLYARRAGMLHAAALEHLTGLAEWQEPTAGMFAWMRLAGGITDADQVLELLKAEQVVVVPGRVAHCYGPRPPFDCPWIRVSFSAVAEPDLKEGMRRIAQVIHRFLKMPNPRPAAAATGKVLQPASDVTSNGHAASSKASRAGVLLTATAHTAANAAPEV